MGFFDRIFKYIKTTEKKEQQSLEQSHLDAETVRDENVTRLLELKDFIDSLAGKNQYIAKSDYVEAIKVYEDTVKYFQVLKSSGMLEPFCLKQSIPTDLAYKVLSLYTDMESVIDQQRGVYSECDDAGKKLSGPYS